MARTHRGTIPHEQPQHTLASLSIPSSDFHGRVFGCRSQVPPRGQYAHRSSTAGPISLLPNELISMVLSHLTFRDLTNLREANYCCMAEVDGFLPYRSFIDHAPNTLEALLVTKVLFKFTARCLFDAMISNHCFSCGSAGQYLFMPVAKRCCDLCLQAAPPLQLISLSAAKMCFGLTDQILSQLSIVLMPQGRFGRPTKEFVSRHWVVSRTAASEAGLELHGSEDAILQFVQPEFDQRNAVYAANHQRWAYRLATGYNPGPPPSRPRNRNAKLNASSGQSNYRVATPMPIITLHSGEEEFVRYCRGCKADRTLFERTYPKDAIDYQEREQEHLTNSRTPWLAADFARHAQVCEGVARLVSPP